MLVSVCDIELGRLVLLIRPARVTSPCNGQRATFQQFLSLGFQVRLAADHERASRRRAFRQLQGLSQHALSQPSLSRLGRGVFCTQQL